MATGTILLPLNAAEPDETNSPGWGRLYTGNRLYFGFDEDVAEKVHWQFRMPENYALGLTAYIQWSASGSSAPGSTVDRVQWSIEVMATTPGTGDSSNSDSYATANTVEDDAGNTVARELMECSKALTNDDGVAAGDYVSIRLSRPVYATEKLAEDARLMAFSLEYTTT